jgi:hypothetical protein
MESISTVRRRSALAIGGRKKNKDAYDLFYVLQHVDGGGLAVGSWLCGLPAHPATEAMGMNLKRDFETIDHPGPRNVCQFLGIDENQELAADVVAQVSDLLRAFEAR